MTSINYKSDKDMMKLKMSVSYSQTRCSNVNEEDPDHGPLSLDNSHFLHGDLSQDNDYFSLNTSHVMTEDPCHNDSDNYTSFQSPLKPLAVNFLRTRSLWRRNRNKGKLFFIL